MNRRTLPTAAAFAATAALLLTACGGGDEDPKDNGKIAGAETGDAKKKESPSASPSGSAGRPAVKLPSDIKNVFENWKTGDPIEDAALADATRRINATDAAIASTEAESEAIPFYTRGDALLGAADWIQGFKKDGVTITGTTRYFNPEVTKYDKSAVGILYCSDESNAFVKDRKTGKVDKTPSAKGPYVLYNTRQDVTKQGVWQTTMLSSERGNEKCTR